MVKMSANKLLLIIAKSILMKRDVVSVKMGITLFNKMMLLIVDELIIAW